jgi:PPOX class probable FMN-dependent enzyme
MSVVTTEAELRDLVPAPPQRAWDKEVDHVDEHVAAFLAASPFCVLATSGAEGRCDASPRGGPPGFCVRLDPHRLAMADYNGNRRQDSNRNLLENAHAGLVFLVPGVKETLRVNGRASLTTDADVLAALPTGGRPPRLALVIEVETCFVHCGKALHRSELWSPGTWPQDVSLLRARAAQGGETVEAVEARWTAGFGPDQLW